MASGSSLGSVSLALLRASQVHYLTEILLFFESESARLWKADVWHRLNRYENGTRFGLLGSDPDFGSVD